MRSFHPSCREGLKLGYRMSDLWWPTTADEALSRGLAAAAPDGKVVLSTEDGAGRVALHQGRRRLAVSYPLLVRELRGEGAFEYVWQTQVFSLLACPERWRPVVALLLEAAQRLLGAASEGEGMQQVGFACVLWADAGGGGRLHGAGVLLACPERGAPC
jgi:hypothetical protein